MFKTLKDFDFKDKRVLIRVDFNVPIDKEGNITNDSRIKKALPTIGYVLDKGARQVILMSHLGEPDKATDEGKKILKMDKVSERLAKLMKKKVEKLDDCVNVTLPDPKDSRVVMLENLRFYKGEKEDNEGFAKALAGHGDVYVNDAFGTCHRPHASVHAIMRFLPACAGLLVDKEITIMGKAISDPERPLVAILGFAKISDKLDLMKNLLQKVDKALIGGAVVFTFLKSQGFGIGKSLVEDGSLKLAKDILAEYEDKIILPSDIVVADRIADDADTKVVGISGIPEDMMGLDIGPETVKFFKDQLKNAKTVIWNGPLGKFETEKFSKGTKDIASFLAKSKAITIIGGGDTAAAIEKLRLEKKMTHVSTGGGASLEFLEGKKLPAIAALEENADSFG
ncbi:phosphoglycerate kinase [Candidatus Woesearchaeota archaeon CG10_big_fil_rev_8_21_14_0_10_44_13]|nr:MAG: phosphoglycerate kinase [Candidatus Woesearchaeota archaeon CG10_big_fil_rev_8_21_14_0_10_44_13]